MDSKPQRPEAVVFDLDGTLADTVLDLAAALNRTLESLISRRIRRRPCERWSAADWRSCWTGASPLMVRRSMATSLAGQKLFDRYPASPTVHSSLYPGTASALGALREAGVALRICTNKPDAIARDLLQTLGLAHAFGVIQGGEEGMRKSPTRPACAAFFKNWVRRRRHLSWSATASLMWRRLVPPGLPASLWCLMATRPFRPARSVPTP